MNHNMPTLMSVYLHEIQMRFNRLPHVTYNLTQPIFLSHDTDALTYFVEPVIETFT